MRGVGGIFGVGVGGVGDMLQTAEVHAWLMHARNTRVWRSRGGGARLGLAWFWNKHPSLQPTDAVFYLLPLPIFFFVHSEAL